MYSVNINSSRRQWLRGIAAPAIGCSIYPTLLEPRWLQFVERRSTFFDAPGQRALTLMHLSDLHASWFVPDSLIETAVDWTVAAQPDLICITGDFVTGCGDFDPKWYHRQLARLAKVAPVYAVLGNHDGGVWASTRGGFKTHEPVRTMVEDAGIVVLHNQSRPLTVAGRRFQVAGVGDYWAEEMEPERAFAKTDPALPTILLSHNPDTKSALGKYAWKLMLSGHTHGGQIRIPAAGTPFAPVVDRRYVDGLRPWRDRWIQVSRGVGNALSVRANCRPEINLLVLS